MSKSTTKLPVKAEKTMPVSASIWRPLDDLHKEIDRLFEDFSRGSWPRLASLEPTFRQQVWSTPAVDIVKNEKAYELTAELPGLEAKNVEVTLRNGNIIIKGEKQAEKEEKSKDYYLHERGYGLFERSFAVPDGVDADKTEATFKNGILKVTLPKTAEAQKPAKTVEVKAA